MSASHQYPHTIDNGAGERLTFVRRVPGRTGDRLEVVAVARPGSGPPMHVHHRQEEALTVVEGRLAYQRSGEAPQYAGPGETVTFAPGDVHRWWNAGEGELRCTGYVEPADNFEYFLTEVFASTRRAGTGRPDPFEAAFLSRRYASEFAITEVPAAVRRFVFPAVEAVGRLLGRYARYADAPAPLPPGNAPNAAPNVLPNVPNAAPRAAAAARAAAALAALTLAACADQAARPTGPEAGVPAASAPASLAVQVNTAAAPAVASLVVEVTAADLPTPLAFTLPVTSGSASGTLRVPPGAARTFAVRAFDAAGNVTHEGTRTTDVRPGANAALAIPLRAAAGQVPISVTLGGVRVTLSRATLSLRPGDTATVSVTVAEADGTPVANPAVTWVSTHPGKLTVSDAGLVTARDTGEARVVAVYDGAAASALVTVGTGPWAQVFAGGSQSCGLTRAGKIYCWGDHSLGQLGTGAIGGGSATPVEVAGGRTYRQLSALAASACAVTTAGAGYCWGYNQFGQLGIGTTVTAGDPRPVAGGHVWASISNAGGHTCGLTTAGKAYCWGDGTKGQNGDSTANTRYVPVAVAGGHTFAQIEASPRHTCALKADGEAWCWGYDNFGQLGINSVGDADQNGPQSNVPMRVAGGLRFRQISAEGLSTCGVTTAGRAYCWGQGTQTGTGITDGAEHRRVPTAVAPHLTFAMVRASTFATCGLTTDGALYCWGYSRPLASETPGADGAVPYRVPAPARLADLQEVAFNHLCATAATGVAYCGGNNIAGKLGTGSTENTTALVKVQDP